MTKTTAIIFSKNRTFQLKSLLLSLRYYSDVQEDCINVIYKADEGVSYQPLEQQFKCKFLRQNNFLQDIKKIVNKSNSDYIWFMVDDLIYRDNFSIRKVENYLDSNEDIDSFCLRLGKNITTKGRQPNFIRDDNGILVWDTKKGQGKHWNYFWELSSSIYRKKLVQEYLSKCLPDKETFPNPFEYHYYSSMPNTRSRGLVGLYLKLRYPLRRRSAKVACFEVSKCFTHGVNLVAEINDKNRAESYSFKELHQKMLDGWIVDFLSPIEPNSPNPGDKFFKLIKETELKQ